MRIHTIEWDDRNRVHATRRVPEAEIEAVFASKPQIRRNKGDGAAGYYALANGIRVNFVYDSGVARPISAWKV